MTAHQRYRERLRWRAYFVLGGVCCECGSRKRLEFAHAIPTQINGMGRGSCERYRDVLANADCYILLCSDCHAETDHERNP